MMAGCLPVCACVGRLPAPAIAFPPGSTQHARSVPQAFSAYFEAWARHRRQFRAVWDCVAEGMEGREVGDGLQGTANGLRAVRRRLDQLRRAA